jgi:ATP-dependent Clp protease ATP-binding subunit ClpC
MFELYTERARRIVFFARYEAAQLGRGAIETEHLLLGLLREGKGLTARVFAEKELTLEIARRQIESHAPSPKGTSIEVPLSPECKRVLTHAADEAGRLGQNYIGTEHLLLGLLRETSSVAARILNGNGIRLEDTRGEVATAPTEMANAGPEPMRLTDLDRKFLQAFKIKLDD